MNRQQLEARKRALVAESEAYRQTLQLQVAQVQLQAEHLKRRLKLILFAQPLVALLPLGFKLLVGRKARATGNSNGKLGGIISAAMMGWRVARRFGPIFSAFRRRARQRRFERRSRAASEGL